MHLHLGNTIPHTRSVNIVIIRLVNADHVKHSYYIGNPDDNSHYALSVICFFVLIG